ncbi:MAG: type IX secretion system membrane protein PorP/SprF [Bacteroidales bacterium]|nr:type IX secretion system membrane protein PorP/SprF [Bacteroidales bacterium]MCF8455879.1 type IX secretion system membrane protein PorP/SprF [Bacteroidales bacterium]
MKNRLLLLFSLIILADTGYAQQFYSKLFQNDFSLYNPAYVGMYEKINAISYTAFWYTTENAPDQKAGINGIHSRSAAIIPVKKYYSAFEGYSNFNTLNDGWIEQKADYGLNYSFKYDFTKNIKVALGSGLAYYRMRYSNEWAYSPETGISSETTDPPYTILNFFRLNLGAWVKLYGFQFGLSGQNLNNPKDELGSFIYSLQQTYNVILSHETVVYGANILKNSILVSRLKNASKIEYYSLASQIAFREKLLIGMSYNAYNYGNYDKPRACISPNIGYNWNDKFNVILSFDLAEKDATPYSNNSLELLVNYKF